MLLRQLEGELADLPDGDAVGDRGGGRQRQALAAPERGLHRRDLFGLDPDYPDLGVLRLDRERNAGDQAPASHRDNDGVKVGALLEQFQPQRPLAGDDLGIVEGMDEGQPALGFDLPGVGVSFVVIGAGQHHLSLVVARGGHLDERGPLRHHDDGANPEALAVKRHGQPVVAGAGRHDSPLPLHLREREELVRRPALFEGARHLEVLELDEAAGPSETRERFGVGAGRGVNRRAEALAGGLDVGEGQHAPHLIQ